MIRFWKKVDKTPGHGPEGDCWLWTGARNPCGYGNLKLDGRNALAHRVSWEMRYGPIPSGPGHHGTCVLHRCDVPACVNPEHLRLGSQAENVADKYQKGRGRHTGAPGESHWSARLTENDVRAIRAAPGTREDIAACFGVTASHVGAIRRREKWRHIL